MLKINYRFGLSLCVSSKEDGSIVVNMDDAVDAGGGFAFYATWVVCISGARLLYENFDEVAVHTRDFSRELVAKNICYLLT